MLGADGGGLGGMEIVSVDGRVAVLGAVGGDVGGKGIVSVDS